MKVVIVEDEIAASDNLSYLLHKIDPTIEILNVIDSVQGSIQYFSKSDEAELIFMDIHLADGISFEIFDKVKINTPIIFTTAYDQYALKAFKVNSVDYLLKPIDKEELSDAINKFKSAPEKEVTDSTSQMAGLLDLLKESQKTFKSSYLVHFKDELIPLKTNDISYFYIDTGMVKAVTFQNQSYTVDKKLEDIENELNPDLFFRINRQFIANREAVESMSFYFNGKLIVKTNPPSKERIVVSKAKSRAFKDWLNK
ncbi:LytR/AlgR family response regulator transcription factor [Urechidicola vernalis]|uniref:LytTR family DNA-binding domain-containing protein n=1 Tax=Urechidicola vernalis TaxID=3075600 RepID=A0ABU2Y1B7_9FLAO|nr:LytTR family DNA-binding domain-containing protein [Urechidicola sp. P050]MDT0551945.1 LytTR family DNA-binding domain-containing protein [Urechidicola sp. P050]